MGLCAGGGNKNFFFAWRRPMLPARPACQSRAPGASQGALAPVADARTAAPCSAASDARRAADKGVSPSRRLSIETSRRPPVVVASTPGSGAPSGSSVPRGSSGLPGRAARRRRRRRRSQRCLFEPAPTEVVAGLGDAPRPLAALGARRPRPRPAALPSAGAALARSQPSRASCSDAEAPSPAQRPRAEGLGRGARTTRRSASAACAAAAPRPCPRPSDVPRRAPRAGAGARR